eukprot:g21568.t1
MDDMSWTSHINATIKMAQLWLFFLRWLWKFGMSITSNINFYRYTIESILSGYIMSWYDNCSAQDHKKLQKVKCTAQTITEANLLSMDLFTWFAATERRPTSSKTPCTLVMTSYN